MKDFSKEVLQLFHIQAKNNTVYKEYLQLLKVNVANVFLIEDIPFMPISFFKTRQVKTGTYSEEKVFQSSGTSQQTISKHYVKSLQEYHFHSQSIFEGFYGDCRQYHFLALLPHYVERGNSSLVDMVKHFMRASGQGEENFYLYDFENLQSKLKELMKKKKKIILFGVTYALVDFANQYPMLLKHTLVVETGGMKTKKQEMTRTEVHKILQQQFQLNSVHSEYGMTELMSQAYSKSNGVFYAPKSMMVMVREIDNPLIISKKGRGGLNIIDIANRHTIAFIATDDYGIVREDGGFEVLGRMQDSDSRGCSLMYIETNNEQ